jgi:hypothetical protein
MRNRYTRSKNRSKRVRAGKTIGKGSNSRSVEYPALPCKDNRYIAPNLVSKQTTEKVAYDEFNNVKGWPTEKYPHMLFPTMVCEGFSDYQVYSPYAKGIPLGQYLRKKLSSSELFACLVALELLSHEVYQFNADGYRHNDVHENNVMYDVASQTAVLIDFGLASRTRSPSRRGFATGKFGDYVNVRSLVHKVETRLTSGLEVKRFNLF